MATAKVAPYVESSLLLRNMLKEISEGKPVQIQRMRLARSIVSTQIYMGRSEAYVKEKGIDTDFFGKQSK
jgi:hypothetical protein